VPVIPVGRRVSKFVVKGVRIVFVFIFGLRALVVYYQWKKGYLEDANVPSMSILLSGQTSNENLEEIRKSMEDKSREKGRKHILTDRESLDYQNLGKTVKTAKRPQRLVHNLLTSYFQSERYSIWVNFE
jgi:hypothetical protein